MECPTSATRVTGTGHAATSRSSSAVSATPFSRRPSPVLARRKTGLQPRAASISPYVVPCCSRAAVPVVLVLAEPVQEARPTRPVASGKACASAGRSGWPRRDRADRTAIAHGQPRPLVDQPVADQPVDRGVDEAPARALLQPRPGPGRGDRVEPARGGAQAEPEPAVDRPGDAAVEHRARRGPGRRAAADGVHPVEHGVVGLAGGADDELVGDLGEQRQGVEEPGAGVVVGRAWWVRTVVIAAG